jgi:hypothetical protein
MSGHRKWSDIRVTSSDPERQARLDQETRLTSVLLSLFQMRERRGVSQEELARLWETSQPNVSKIEHQDDVLVSTLRRYVEALGGRLEVQAVFPEERIVLDLSRGGQPEERPRNAAGGAPAGAGTAGRANATGT